MQQPTGTRLPGRAPSAPGRVLRALGRPLLLVWRAIASTLRQLGQAARRTGPALREIRHGLARLFRGVRTVGSWLPAAARWLASMEGQGSRTRASVTAWAIAIVLSFITFGTAAAVFDITRLGWGLMMFIGAMIGLPFGLIATRPMVGWAISTGTALVFAVVLPTVDRDPWPWPVVHGLIMLALLFAVCARERPQLALLAWLGTALLFYAEVPHDIRVGWAVGVSITAVIGALAGRLVLTNLALNRQTRLSNQEKAQRMLLQERARIARDLHDIVAHHMSLIVVQAETAPYRVPDLPDSARAELDAVGSSARAALAETRALLAVLRQHDEPAERAPQPGLEQLEELVASSRQAGLLVEADLDPLPPGLLPGTSLAGYRIAQEALANAARHAPGAWVRVQLRALEAAVELEVHNGPPPGFGPQPAPADEDANRGHGLTGMQERARAVGGSLVVGPDDAGGYLVRAQLPASPAYQVAAAAEAGREEG